MNSNYQKGEKTETEGKFTNHPEVTWKAEPAGGFGSPPLQSTIDLKNYVRERFVDLRAESNYTSRESYKLRLIGNAAYIYIKGPDSLINILCTVLSYCKEKNLV